MGEPEARSSVEQNAACRLPNHVSTPRRPSMRRGAYALGIGARLGTLESGKLADRIVIDEIPWQISKSSPHGSLLSWWSKKDSLRSTGLQLRPEGQNEAEPAVARDGLQPRVNGSVMWQTKIIIQEQKHGSTAVRSAKPEEVKHADLDV